MDKRVVYTSGGLWLFCFVGAFVAARLTVATGDGFGRGLNRVVVFLQWQGAAGLVAVCAALATRAFPKPRTRVLTLLGMGPLTITGTGVVLLVMLVAWVRFGPK